MKQPRRPAARERRITFTVPYPGAAASSNQGYAPALFRREDGTGRMGFRLTDAARAYKQECFYKALEAWQTSDWLPAPGDRLTVTIQGRFPSHQHADVSNLGKFIVDSIKEALDHCGNSKAFYNDREWAVTVEPPQYERGCEPTITVTVEG